MSGLNYVTFNQDHSLLAVATTRGLRVYATDPFELTNHSYDEDISIVEQLFSTSLVAMILTPRLLRIVNTKRNSTICELTFHGMVVAVKMNRKRLVVMLEEVVFIYDISNMKMLHQQNTPLNPSGICAVSPNSDNNYLALPHYQKSPPNMPAQAQSHVPKSLAKEQISGDVLLYDLNKMEEVTVIPAHQTAVSALAINNDGTLLATSSEKGTIIRIFALPSGKKLYQFRRGSIPARIYCMSFNATSTLLCVSSATETVHVFKLAPPSSSTALTSNPNTIATSSSPLTSTSPPTSPPLPSACSETHPHSPPASPPTTTSPPPAPPQPTLLSLLRRTSHAASSTLVTRAANYLPASVTEIWEPQRDFAWVRLPKSGGSGGGGSGSGNSGNNNNNGTSHNSSSGNPGGGGGGSGSGGAGGPVRSVVAMANAGAFLLVATGEGEVLVYSVDLSAGGEGTLVRRFDDIHGLKGAKAEE